MKVLGKLMVMAMAMGLPACGGDDASPADARVIIDAHPTIDAAVADAAPVVCEATADYATVVGTNVTAVWAYDSTTMMNDPNTILFSADANQDTDIVNLQLYKDFGTSTYHGLPGTYEITGPELDYETCGVCVRLFANTAGGNIGQMYMATGGTVVLTQIGPNLTGELQNVTFEHVTGCTPTVLQCTPTGDGCASSLTSMTFDQMLVNQPAP